MKTRFAILLTLCAVLFAPNAYSQKPMTGLIEKMSIDQTSMVEFSGEISFATDTVTIKYWKPGKLNRGKILPLTVKFLQTTPGEISFTFDNFGNDKLFDKGLLQYNSEQGTFYFRAWNKTSSFAYQGKLL